MAAVGWYVGLVHYPTFARIPADDWRGFHDFHSQRTGVVVMVPMLLQLLLTIMFSLSPNFGPLEKTVQLLFAVFSFGWTFATAVPCHSRLSSACDEAVLRRLLATNHVRAVAWTGQALFSAWLLVRSAS